jgi:hypothetical protein
MLKRNLRDAFLLENEELADNKLEANAKIRNEV